VPLKVGMCPTCPSASEDATRRSLVHLYQGYSPNLVEGVSRKFAFLNFSAPLCQAALCEGACESAIRFLKTASEMRRLRQRSASLRDLPSAIFLR
jgi:hypothetical protein